MMIMNDDVDDDDDDEDNDDDDDDVPTGPAGEMCVPKLFSCFVFFSVAVALRENKRPAPPVINEFDVKITDLDVTF